MRVEVDSIPIGDYLVLEEDNDLSGWDMDRFDVKFIGDIHMRCSFTKVEKDIFVQADVNIKKEIICSRCLDNKLKEESYTFNFHYTIPNSQKYIEMDKDIREEILLRYPIKVLCRDDCKGLCPYCGVNLNYEKCSCVRMEDDNV